VKYKVKRYDVEVNRRVDKELEIEADHYQRDGRTYTFFRGNTPVGTYENVTQVEEVREV
jgi:hypothetical protein